MFVLIYGGEDAVCGHFSCKPAGVRAPEGSSGGGGKLNP